MVIVPGSQLSQLPPGLDSTEFAAIVGNLLDNAFEASLRSDEGNKIVELYLSDEGDDVVIEVADQGCGVPESLRDKIFEQGVSTRADEPGEPWHWVVLDCQLRNALRWCYHSRR